MRKSTLATSVVCGLIVLSASHAITAAEPTKAAVALAELGQKADLPETPYDQTAPVPLFAKVWRHLSELPAEQRYLLLKTWTLPTSERDSVRLVSAFVPGDGPPPEFKAADVSAIAQHGLTTSANLLIDAAREAGKLDELADELAELADVGNETAETLYLLAQISAGRSAEVEFELQERLQKLPAKLEVLNRTRRYPASTRAWSDYLIARACMDDPEMQPHGEQIARVLMTFPHNWAIRSLSLTTYITRALEESLYRRQQREEPVDDPRLALWHPAAHSDSMIHWFGTVPLWWTAEKGTLQHVVGPCYDRLFFRYPLTGSFEFSADSYCTSTRNLSIYRGTRQTEWAVIYGGLVVDRTVVAVVGGQERLYFANTFGNEDAFNQITIRVRPDKVQHLINDTVVYEAPNPRPSSPWLALGGWGAHRAEYRNLRFTGEPTIPREVALVDGNHVEGWSSFYYFETQPLDPHPIPEGGARRLRRMLPTADAEVADWYAHEGVVYGRRRTPDEWNRLREETYNKYDHFGELRYPLRAGAYDQDRDIQSRFLYDRPLLTGETLSYDFFYEPGEVEVHPALGRLSFLLEPGGVRLHWMTDVPRDDPTGLAPGNAVEVPEDRRGPNPLPLNPGEWNAVQLSLDGDTVHVRLNGVEVYERTLQATNDRIFSLFHWKDRSAVKVRNVMLTGDWPEKLTPEMLANLLAKSGEVKGADR